MIRVGREVGEYVDSVYEAAIVLKGRVNAATSVGKALAVNLKAEWPQSALLG